MFLRAGVKGSSKSRLVTSTLAKWYTIYRILNSHSFKVAKKPFQTLGHIFAKSKDPVTKEQSTDLVYSIPCNNCDNEYIRQTKPQFGTRLKEHQKAVLSRKKGNFSFIGAHMPN